MVRHRATPRRLQIRSAGSGRIEENDAQEDCYAISEANPLEVFVQGNIGADCQGENAEAIS
jgi:hypothetical protein